MATFTTRLNATKPASSENAEISVLNNNFDLIDAAVGASVGTSAARPASAFQGRIYYATDSAKLAVNSAASASVAASWQDPVASALASGPTINGSITVTGQINSTRSSSTSGVILAKVTGDADARFWIPADGLLEWGSGSGGTDTNLYRGGANTLKTDDSLIVGGGLTSIGTLTASTGLNVGGAAALNGGLTVVGKGSKEYLRKATSQGRISTTTLANDSHLTFNLAASATYELRVHLAVTGATAGDVKTAYVFTGAASGGSHTSRWGIGPQTGTTDNDVTSVVAKRASWATSISYGVDAVDASYITEGGIIDTTAGSGTITLQWAQNSSTATSTVVTNDSYAVLERLA